VAPFWALGLFLLAGGLLAVAMPLGLATNAGDLEPWERFVQLDLTHRRLRVVRAGLSGRQIRSLSFDDLESVEVDHGTDGDGGTVWRLAVRLRTGELVLLSQLWSHDQAAVEEGVSVVAEACRLPTPSFPAGAQA
jgi:hypothetical protein